MLLIPSDKSKSSFPVFLNRCWNPVKSWCFLLILQFKLHWAAANENRTLWSVRKVFFYEIIQNYKKQKWHIDNLSSSVLHVTRSKVIRLKHFCPVSSLREGSLLSYVNQTQADVCDFMLLHVCFLGFPVLCCGGSAPRIWSWENNSPRCQNLLTELFSGSADLWCDKFFRFIQSQDQDQRWCDQKKLFPAHPGIFQHGTIKPNPC